MLPERSGVLAKEAHASCRGKPRYLSGRSQIRGPTLSLIDEGISFLREIARILAVLHGSQDLGNKTDPTDELVYIILARKTRESAYQQTYDVLKRTFARWDDLIDSPREKVEKLVFSGGLSEKKTTSLFGALGKLRETFGSCTLEPARSWSDEELERFLRELPEIERKSAYCIMMYAFGRRSSRSIRTAVAFSRGSRLTGGSVFPWMEWTIRGCRSCLWTSSQRTFATLFT